MARGSKGSSSPRPKDRVGQQGNNMKLKSVALTRAPDAAAESASEKRRLQRRSSNEVCTRALKLKLGCFAKTQVACNKNGQGQVAEEVVLAEVRRCRTHRCHIQASFWLALIRDRGLGGTRADGLQQPVDAQPVSNTLDVALRTAHSANPAARSSTGLLKVLDFREDLDETEYFGCLRGAIESPTMCKNMSQQIMEGLLRYTARTRCDQQWPHYFNHMKDHWDQLLLHMWMKAVTKQMTRAQFLRCWRAELSLFFSMEKASCVAQASDDGQEPRIAEIEELSSSSLIGQELFSPEVMLAELLHFKTEVARRLSEVELQHFPEDEMQAFREISMRLAENLDEQSWAELDCRQQQLGYCSGSVVARCVHPNDLWFNCREARIRTLAVSNIDVPRLPWEKWLYGDKPILGCPRTIRIPDNLVFDMANCREFLIKKFEACQPLTLEGAKRIVRSNAGECRRLDKNGFWLDEMFLDTQVDELLESHCKTLLLAILPKANEKRSLAKAEPAGRLLLSGETIMAQKVSLQRDLRHALDLLTEISDGRGPTAAEVSKISLWCQMFLKQAEHFCQWSEYVQDDKTPSRLTMNKFTGADALHRRFSSAKATKGIKALEDLMEFRSFAWLLNGEDGKLAASWQQEAVSTAASRLNESKAKALKDVEESAREEEREESQQLHCCASPEQIVSGQLPHNNTS